MHLINEIISAGGDITRKPDSRYLVTLWYIPGGYDYANAKVVVGFWPEHLREAAEQFTKKYDYPGEMASMVDLQDPKAEHLFKPHPCKHCGKMVNYRSIDQWVSDGNDGTEQYCWIDPVKGSQRHEV